MPLSILVVGLATLAQGVALLFNRSPRSRTSIEFLSTLGFLAAIATLAVGLSADQSQIWFGLLEDQPLFRLPRAALFVAALLLGRGVVATEELPAKRKHEVLFLLSTLVMLCDLLLLSRQMTLSIILLVCGSWLSLFLGGLAFRGRGEGEAVLKYWIQASLVMAGGFGAATALAVVAGGVHYDVISSFLHAQSSYSLSALLVVSALCLPFVMAAGLFPFHFAHVDRDQGMPWPVVVTLSVVWQGTVTLALWKMGVEVFGKARPGEVSEGLRTLQLCGLSGGFWLALVALTQENSKRLFSALVGAQWSAILVAGALPTVLSASSITYAFASVFVWTSLLGFNWGRFQESAGGENLKDVYGAARTFRSSGLLLLLALASPLCIPGLPGFPMALNLLAAMMEQKSLFFLAAEVLLVATLSLISIRVGTDLLFRQRASSSTNTASLALFRYGALEWLSLTVAIVALTTLGFLWHRVFALLFETAKVFLK